MAVVANAGSGAAYVFADLPIANHQLTGAATGGSGTYTIWKWYILDGPDGHGASFDDDSLQSPKLQSIDTDGDYLLFLVVTDDLSEESEGDPVAAPDSARVTIRVTTQYAALPKPATGARNWQDDYVALVDEIDDQRNDQDTHTIASHDTTATGAELTELTDGSTTTLHDHAASSVPDASTTTKGVGKTAQAPASPTDPKFVAQDLFVLDGAIVGTLTATGWQPAVVKVPAAPGNESTASLPGWHVIEAFHVTDVSASMLDTGDDTGGGASGTTFTLYEMTAAQYAANDFAGATTIGAVTVTVPATKNRPNSAKAAITDHLMTVDNLLVVRVTAAPNTPGTFARVTIHGRQKW